MNKKVTVALIVVLLLAIAGGYVAMHKKSTTTTSSYSSATTGAGAPAKANNTLASLSMTPSFAITATDNGADHDIINVKKGAQVTLTFNVSSSGVYHGGLQFKSTDPALDSGPVAPGSSKTVTFTADKTFSFQPYWYANQVKKDYLIAVNVN